MRVIWLTFACGLTVISLVVPYAGWTLPPELTASAIYLLMGRLAFEFAKEE